MIVADSIPIIRPDVLYHEVEHDVRGVLASGILTSGRHVADFEKAVADFVGVDHAVATTSATTALHLSLVALGVEQGDEVLVPDFTFPATANAVIQTGATPVFVDSGIGDFSMDPESAAMHISDRTRVIMPVDPFGQPADHLALARLADDVGARLVVDAACSLGATRDNVRCGAHGTMGCFSFHPRKVVTCGEGGMVTTDDSDLAERLRLLRNHGAISKCTPGMEFVEPGFHQCAHFILCSSFSGTLTTENIVGKGIDEHFIKEARFLARAEIDQVTAYPEIFSGPFWDDLADGFPETRYLGIKRVAEAPYVQE